MRIGLAFRLFFTTLFQPKVAAKLKECLVTSAHTANLPQPDSNVATALTPVATKPDNAVRSEAITLLATLQREARLLDLVQEPLEGYTDAQIGAAARDVLRDTSKVLQRLFQLDRLASQPEGETIELPDSINASRWRLIGSSSKPKFGTLVHSGWQAKAFAVPQWTGDSKDALVISPAEVEVR